MSARNGDKSRFHRLRKAKIQRRLRTELLHSLVTTHQELPAKHPAPAEAASSEPASSEPAANEAPASEASEGHKRMGPLAAAAKTLGSTLGTLVAKTTHTHADAANEA